MKYAIGDYITWLTHKEEPEHNWLRKSVCLIKKIDDKRISGIWLDFTKDKKLYLNGELQHMTNLKYTRPANKKEIETYQKIAVLEEL